MRTLPRKAAIAGLAVFPIVLMGLSVLFCSDSQNPFKAAADISYPDSVIAYPGVPLSPILPTRNNNVAIDYYGIDTPLPAGLTFDSLTGEIAGTATDTPLVYTCTINAYNEWGTSNDVPVVVMVCPARPGELSGFRAADNQVSLVWRSVAGADAYMVYRAPSAAGPFATVATEADTALEDRTGIQVGSTYFYYVLAWDAATYPSFPSDTISVLVTDRPDTVTPEVRITWPAGDTLVRDASITVRYTVNGFPLTEQVTLSEGLNTVVVDSTTPVGKSGADTVRITLDTTPPETPAVTVPASSATRKPTWTWSSDGNGNGTFRYRLDSSSFTDGGTETTDMSFTPGSDLSDGSHTLYVQERDDAGNWSTTGSATTTIGGTPLSITIQTPATTRDSVVVDTSILAVSGTVTEGTKVASVTVHVNGSSTTSGAATGAQWSASTNALQAATWNVVVVAIRDSLNREASDTMYVFGRFGLARPAAPTVGERLCTAIEVTWSVVEHCDRYSLWRRMEGGTDFMQVAAGVGDTSFLDTGLTSGAAYEYRIQASYGRQDGSFHTSDTTAPSMHVTGISAICFVKDLGMRHIADVGTTTDGGYILAGEKTMSNTVHLARTDPYGVEQWGRTYSIGNATHERVFSVTQIGGGFVASGWASTDDSTQGFLLRTTSNGFGQADAIYPWCTVVVSVVATPSGELGIACEEGDSTRVATISSSGNHDTLWTRAFNDASSPKPQDMVLAADGGVVVCGVASDYFSECSLFVAKVTSTNTVPWTKYFRKPEADLYRFCDIAPLQGGGFLVACNNGWILKLSETGDSSWSCTVAGGVVDDIAEAGDGGVLAIGDSASVARLVWISPEGDIVRSATIPQATKATVVQPTADGGYILGCGSKLVKTDCRGNTVP